MNSMITLNQERVSLNVLPGMEIVDFKTFCLNLSYQCIMGNESSIVN